MAPTHEDGMKSIEELREAAFGKPSVQTANPGKPDRKTIIAVLVTTAAAALIAIWFLFPHGEEPVVVEGAQPPSTTSAQPGDVSAPPDADASAAASEPAEPEARSVVAYVTGAVAQPGVVTLPAPARYGDAVLAAGGLREDAAQAAVNLAQPLEDGTQVHVPTQEEFNQGAAPPATASASSASSGPQSGGKPGAGSSQQAPAANGKVNINTADAAALQQLDGVGPATAQRIIDYRTANGRFKSIEELRNVSGIGEKKFAAIAPHVTV
jgi:competence protein ComEA